MIGHRDGMQSEGLDSELTAFVDEIHRDCGEYRFVLCDRRLTEISQLQLRITKAFFRRKLFCQLESFRLLSADDLLCVK